MTKPFARALLAVAALLVVAFGSIAYVPAVGAQPEIDQEVPPGNPVIGSDAPGDRDPDNNESNYALLAMVAGVMIIGGGLLVKIERWERGRTAEAGV